MDRRIIVLFCVLALILSGCVPNFGNDPDSNKIVKKSDKGKKQKKVKITPKVESIKNQYRTVVDFKPGAARGHILYGVANRLDIDEIQTGLMRLSKDVYSPDRYIFQEGQYLERDMIENWLENESQDNPEGLNPDLPKGYKKYSAEKKVQFLSEHPSYLSYVTEQDYLVQAGKDQLKLGGLSIAISMAKVYSFKVEDADGNLYRRQIKLDEKKAKEKAKQFADVIVKRIREIEALKNVPIVIGLYQEQAAESLVPGHYFAKTVVKAEDSSVGEWEPLKETHVLFPSVEASEHYQADTDHFEQFRSQVQDYFPNYVDVIGKAFYKQKELQHMTIDIPIKFYAETEVISFSQFIAGLLSDQNNPFPQDVPIDVYISSAQGPEALVVLNPDRDEPFVHVYKNK
ncbi:MAG TPA: CamS family sex pheromone protein [Bacillales bacterium]|nr:CamS family sex pheromone protein [Bacillales bacterium]